MFSLGMIQIFLHCTLSLLHMEMITFIFVLKISVLYTVEFKNVSIRNCKLKMFLDLYDHQSNIYWIKYTVQYS